MGLEAASYITQLVTTNPLGTDQRSTSDDHHRLVKTVLQTQFSNFSATAVLSTVNEINKLAGKTGAVGHLGEAGAWVAQQGFSEYSLSDSTSVSWNLNIAQTAKWPIGGARVLVNPSNMVAGNTYILRVVNQLSATASISFGSAFLFANGTAPTLTKSLSAVDIFSFYCDGTSMHGAMAIPNSK